MAAEKPAPVCPVCGKSAVPATAPFCSVRCKNVDLNRWLVGHYRVETDEAPDATQSVDTNEE